MPPTKKGRMKRHYITLGATTTAGGIVTTASSACTIEETQMALEGDAIECTSCQATGTILCIGPRISETWSGKQAALENDLCMCKCTPPPRLLGCQTLRYQQIDSADNSWTSISNRMPAGHGETFDQRVFMSDSLTGVPLARQPYRLQAAGKVLEGVTDEEGFTEAISTGAHPQNVDWCILGEPT